ncbi:MAG: hypothetical protein DHS20C18_34910 [Saprospiraceae bacterium]|nr:MAG: hypothetical protein DHS20C18_34910 [Saprospiraceae bacterium]
MASDKKNPRTPGVYIKEIPSFQSSIAQVETAIPAFIGYTEKAVKTKADDLRNIPRYITSLGEYTQYFGVAKPEGANIQVTIDTAVNPPTATAEIQELQRSKYLMYYSVQAFFANGGSRCYIVSVGDYTTGLVEVEALRKGLQATRAVQEITLIVFPDSIGLIASADYYDLHQEALSLCADLEDRFTVMDVWVDPANPDAPAHIDTLRNSSLGNSADSLKYGAVYYPRLETTLDFQYDPALVRVVVAGAKTSLSSLEKVNSEQYNLAKNAISRLPLILPAASAVVGVYAQVDATDGVWKAPANINIDRVIKPVVSINNEEQSDLIIDAIGGKSINAIRSFSGRGPAIIWGARTLAGNDNEWRYVPVHRFSIMAETSIKLAIESFVFEPNDANTWGKAQSMIENFLTTLWRDGGLQGSRPNDAFFVQVGLGVTMTAQDILDGKMIVQVGIAMVHPAEFIILSFIQEMQNM